MGSVINSQLCLIIDNCTTQKEINHYKHIYLGQDWADHAVTICGDMVMNQWPNVFSLIFTNFDNLVSSQNMNKIQNDEIQFPLGIKLYAFSCNPMPSHAIICLSMSYYAF